jgi:hypothetical protein
LYGGEGGVEEVGKFGGICGRRTTKESYLSALSKMWFKLVPVEFRLHNA